MTTAKTLLVKLQIHQGLFIRPHATKALLLHTKRLMAHALVMVTVLLKTQTEIHSWFVVSMKAYTLNMLKCTSVAHIKAMFTQNDLFMFSK